MTIEQKLQDQSNIIINFTPNLNNLKSLGFIFEKYSSYNFIRWSKNGVSIWKSGNDLTIEELYNWEKAFIISFIEYKKENEHLFPLDLDVKIFYSKNNDYNNQKVIIDDKYNSYNDDLYFLYLEKLNKILPRKEHMTDEELVLRKKKGQFIGIYEPQEFFNTYSKVSAEIINVLCELIDLNYISTSYTN
jgi:hypothetical protein